MVRIVRAPSLPLGYSVGGSTDERVLPHQLGYRVRYIAHWARYEYAAAHGKIGCAVDVGCGTGYGTKILSRACEHVFGCDLSLDAIEYARTVNAAPNVSYAVADARRLEVDDGSAALVVSFEVIEHVSDLSRPRFTGHFCGERGDHATSAWRSRCARASMGVR